MARSLAQIFQDADAIIEKLASDQAKTPPRQIDEDEVTKLAAEVLSDAAPLATEFHFDDLEKLAHSMAILETVLSAPELLKFQEFEKKATEQGFTPEQINSVLEKAAGEAIPTEAGQRVLHFMEGAGGSLQKIINAIPKVTRAEPARSAGAVAGFAAPALAALGLGGYLGSKYKEREFRQTYGVQ